MSDNTIGIQGDQVITKSEAQGRNQPQTSVGAALIKARETAGLSGDDIARRLNCLPTVIRALEQNRFDYFRNSAYAIGYLRAYAKAVALNAEPLVAIYRASLPPAPAVKPITSLRQPYSNFEAAPKGRWAAALVMMVVVGLWWVQSDDAGVETTRVIEHRIDALTNPLVTAVPDGNPVIDEALTADPVDAKESPAAGSLGDNAAASAAPSAVDTLPTQSNADLASATSANDVAGDNTLGTASDRLLLRFGADCWVEIKDRDGELMVAVLKHQGDTLEVTGDGPFNVLLGFVPAVEEMLFNGEKVRIDSVAAGTQSARLWVGSET